MLDAAFSGTKRAVPTASTVMLGVSAFLDRLAVTLLAVTLVTFWVFVGLASVNEKLYHRPGTNVLLRSIVSVICSA